MSLFITGIVYVQFANEHKTIVAFCNVGQGDGAYIRINNKIDILIDAGPDQRILDCLGKYMPPFDHTIELVIMSHPQKDHIGGFLYVLPRYRVNKLAMTQLRERSKTFSDVLKRVRDNRIAVIFVTQGMRFTFEDADITFLWPSEDFLKKNLQFDPLHDENYALSSLDDNDFSVVNFFQQGNYRILFTGDASIPILNRLSYQSDLKTTILKIPHHGSKNGLTPSFLKLADPRVSVISVGKHNSYHHPSKDVLDMLQASKTQVRRTDEEGDIVFKIPN